MQIKIETLVELTKVLYLPKNKKEFKEAFIKVTCNICQIKESEIDSYIGENIDNLVERNYV